MIALASDYMVFELASGESVPLSAEMVSVEVGGVEEDPGTDEFLQEAAGAVFYYYKHELKCQTVTLAEFSEALEKVIQGFRLNARPANGVLVSDLKELVETCGPAGELVFFPKLRAELRSKLQQSPNTLRFRGLRGCVKQLVGTTRWTARCEALRLQIVLFLRECLHLESPVPQRFSLVVE